MSTLRSLTPSSQERLQIFLDEFRLANPYAISDADYGDALSTIRTLAQTQAHAIMVARMGTTPTRSLDSVYRHGPIKMDVDPSLSISFGPIEVFSHYRLHWKSSDHSPFPHSELTPWSMQEIERVVKSNSAALKDAISVFGSEAAVMFAVTNAAKTGLANMYPFEEDKCLCIQQGTLTPQSRIDVDNMLRQPGALDSVQRHWPSVDAAVQAAIENAEQYLKSRDKWNFALPPGVIPACSSSPGAMEYLDRAYFTCDEGLKACGDEYCIPVDQPCNTLCDTVSPSFLIQNDATSTLFVFDPLCACISNGVLTIQSRNDLQDAVDQEDPAAIDSAIRYWGSKDAIVSAVFADAQRKVAVTGIASAAARV
ncbi:hypothetical protein QFC20_002939 [Naganishia adeliensis]|uniref:Uncharacterized protein n=1 Tax=Naganishia adeliensis TaxID=92952 RepID=A0ACC2WG15_9TREE|nr:hypothetical protein QFC20_002939 [Naganishia adeliensis]